MSRIPMPRRGAGYLAGAAGIAAITGLIGALDRWVDLPALAVTYVVLVIYVGARFGRPPAIATALVGFLAYEFFFVPPYGSLAVNAPRDVLGLVALLAAAGLSEFVVSTLVRRTAGAEAAAQESRGLYEVALAVLREPEPGAALELLCSRAAAEPGIASVTILEDQEGRAVDAAGAASEARERQQAEWCLRNGSDLGVRVEPDRLVLFRQSPPQPAFLRVAQGVVVFRVEAPGPSADSSRVLAALAGLAGLLLDRERARRQSVRARDLEDSVRIKSGVLSALSHEVKTPLASLRAGLSAMELDRSLAPEQRELLAGLEAQTARLDRVVQGVLTMTRLEEGLAGERVPVGVSEVVGSAMASLDRLLEPFRLSVEIPEALPPVIGDEVQLDRLFANLLENASQWTAPGGEIRVGARLRDGEIEAWVENDGPEVPGPITGDVFNSYWSARRGGSGLGLAICRRIAEAHGGSISARNLRGGPRFTVRLPALEEAG